MTENCGFECVGAWLGMGFNVFVALGAVPSTNPNCSNGSQSRSRKVILYSTRHLRIQRAKCNNTGTFGQRNLYFCWLLKCGSQSLSRRVILYHTRDLGNQRAKCDNIGPKLFMIFGRLFGHNSSFMNSFWLRLFVVRVRYHTQVWGSTTHSRKFIGKNVGGAMVERMGEVEGFFSKF